MEAHSLVDRFIEDRPCKQHRAFLAVPAGQYRRDCNTFGILRSIRHANGRFLGHRSRCSDVSRSRLGVRDGKGQCLFAILVTFDQPACNARSHQLNAPIASEALARIAAIYAIEAEVRGQEAEARRSVRQQRTKPIVGELKNWLESQLAAVSRKSTIAEAIRYGLSRWDGLVRFLEDGRIEVDSNVVERTIRPIALNRKNALFAGSDGGGKHWAILASLIETCKLNGIDPQVYLTDILARIANDHPINRINELLPWVWLPSNLDLVCHP
jgi:hypothetical protein